MWDGVESIKKHHGYDHSSNYILDEQEKQWANVATMNQNPKVILNSKTKVMHQDNMKNVLKKDLYGTNNLKSVDFRWIVKFIIEKIVDHCQDNVNQAIKQSLAKWQKYFKLRCIVDLGNEKL